MKRSALQLLQARAGLQSGLDAYKTGTLGLPPYLEVKVDDSFIEQFQFIDPDITLLQDTIVAFQDEMGALPTDPNNEQLASAIERAAELLGGYQTFFAETDRDIEGMAEQSETRKKSMTAAEQRQFDRDFELLKADYEKRPAIYAQLEAELMGMAASDMNVNGNQVLRQLVGWTRRLSDELQSLSLIQARARLESVVLKPVELDSRTALNIARASRLDYMNNRAALVDSWRLIAFNADQLQSTLNVRMDGDIGTVGRNPAEFRAPTGSLTASLEFDAPLTRLTERNNYRQSLVDYQESRRQLIQFDDTLSQSLRQRLRDLEQLRTNLEIQRRAVVISIRRVDFTRAELNRPLPAPDPGAAPNTFGPTAVQNLLSALSDLSNAQNNFMSVWLNYYAGRMLLIRDLGVMVLDEQGRWIDLPLDQIVDMACFTQEGLPPAIPNEWWQYAEPLDESVPTQPSESGPTDAAIDPRQHRLPPTDDAP